MRDFEQDRKICEAAAKGPWEIYERDYAGAIETLQICANDNKPAFLEMNGYSRDEGANANAKFIVEAREGWPAALNEIESLKRQLALAAKEAAKGCCPYDANKAFALICKEHCSDDDDCSDRCWIEYWRQKETAEKSSDIGTTSKTEIVGEGAE